ncbi:MAG: flagellar biosynthesis anti-sigma factor FlgM [Clostridiales Family XIII bacterium]|jgi:anti-sigma28 factor (negative regulator of flagellin synthesis)|nr:flagellar biosynthesis anti-sigma factor FlgM [Clostridiales Family XIII bacterium]
MEISSISKARAAQPQAIQEATQDAVKNIKNDGGDRLGARSKIDKAEISSGHAGIFDDKRLSVAKSALLYDISSDTPNHRIDDIRERVASGTYAIRDDELAEALID